MNYYTRVSVFILLLLFGQAACADTENATEASAETAEADTANETNQTPATATSDADVDKFRELMAEKVPSMPLDYVAVAPLPGFFEVLTDGQLIYISTDANFILSGRLFSIENGIVDLSSMAKDRIDMMRAPIRKSMLAQVDPEEMILFKAANEKHRITVFTDVDCGWCRNLHREMSNYNELGISVQYMAYPRAGMGSSSYDKLRSVWCSDDKVAAMNTAKLKQEFGENVCDDPIREHLDLVREFGIRGTPALILESGRLIQSYVKPSDLIQVLDEDRQANAATTAAETSSD